jgi:membrane protein DedA with SNARE-associated domain
MPDINQLITNWGYAGIFVVVILGSIGLPVPEETVLAVAGYLVWSDRVQLLPVLIVGLISAVAGDTFGYWLGRRYGRAAVERYARRLLTPARVVVAESFVSRYGALAPLSASGTRIRLTASDREPDPAHGTSVEDGWRGSLARPELF